MPHQYFKIIFKISICYYILICFFEIWWETMVPSFWVVGIGEIRLSGAKRLDCDWGRGTIFQKSCVWLVRHKHLTQWLAASFVILKLIAEGGNRFNSNRKASTFWLSQKIGHIRFVCLPPPADVLECFRNQNVVVGRNANLLWLHFSIILYFLRLENSAWCAGCI